IKREGEVQNVQRQLQPSRIDQAQAKRWRGPHGQVLDDEAEPVRHLRAYSNYLAPQPGFFSADGWVLVAAYVRNLLLNQLVLLLPILSLLFAMAVVVQVFSIAAHVPDIPAWLREDPDYAGKVAYKGAHRTALWWGSMGTISFVLL